MSWNLPFLRPAPHIDRLPDAQAVSYTHLVEWNLLALVLVFQRTPGTVSYTHLDVYKRQDGYCA